jgi:hypothetical protein
VGKVAPNRQRWEPQGWRIVPSSAGVCEKVLGALTLMSVMMFVTVRENYCRSTFARATGRTRDR